ncbi:MAG: hypothetical protein CSA55_02320 [Ilumatobacter coccineus]|uniref:DUF58 domain-containing protein n=1 Tax=Ilumatobacter coccineus TaxID=467094 RepID=A0A2G6KBQ4_9ACTN|nr:MAG: hypothetical protein CSA55_02320 [Ilumatobacter coccineus]
MIAPTGPGWTALGAAATLGVVGRLLALTDLFIVAAGLAAATIIGMVIVAIRQPRVAITRHIRPLLLTVGHTGRVDLRIEVPPARRSPPIDLIEPVGPRHSARLHLDSLPSGKDVTVSYQVPTRHRGRVLIGPLVIDRDDPIGLAHHRRMALGRDEILVAPRAELVPLPELGRGPLGQRLLTAAHHRGIGEFDGLRDYGPGDELRMIDWKASARHDDLKVRLTEPPHLTRFIVILDQDSDEHPFEVAVTVAASLVVSAEHGGLTTRLVTTDHDLSGPDIADRALRALAVITPNGELATIERDPSEGLGLIVVITPSSRSSAWQAAQRVTDPSLLLVGLFTDPDDPGDIAARSAGEFVDNWCRLVGQEA